MAADPFLSVRGLGKSFAGRPAIQDVTFSLERGHTLGLVGPSGSGKSTLARCLALFETPTSGEIWLDGREGHARRYPAHLPGAGLEPQPAIHRRPDRHRASAHSQNRNPKDAAATGIGVDGDRRASPPGTRKRRRSNSAAVSGSGWPSRGRWPSNRNCSFWTSPLPVWIFPFRPRLPACCWTCRSGAA